MKLLLLCLLFAATYAASASGDDVKWVAPATFVSEDIRFSMQNTIPEIGRITGTVRNEAVGQAGEYFVRGICTGGVVVEDHEEPLIVMAEGQASFSAQLSYTGAPVEGGFVCDLYLESAAVPGYIVDHLALNDCATTLPVDYWKQPKDADFVIFYRAHISLSDHLNPQNSHILGPAQYDLVDKFSLVLEAIPLDAAWQPYGPASPVPADIALSTTEIVIAYDTTVAPPEYFYQHWLDGVMRDDNSCEECLPLPATMTPEQRDFYFPLDPMPTW